MTYAYSILMAAFAAALLLYAGIMAITKDYKLLPFRSRQSVKPKNEKKYMTMLSKAVALTSAAPALSALVGLWSVFTAVFVLIAGFIVCIFFSTRIVRNEE